MGVSKTGHRPRPSERAVTQGEAICGQNIDISIVSCHFFHAPRASIAHPTWLRQIPLGRHGESWWLLREENLGAGNEIVEENSWIGWGQPVVGGQCHGGDRK